MRKVIGIELYIKSDNSGILGFLIGGGVGGGRGSKGRSEERMLMAKKLLHLSFSDIIPTYSVLA